MAVTCASNVLCDIIHKGHELIDTFFGEFLALLKEILKNKEGLQRTKGITMVQWTNINWNNRFINPPSLPPLCEVSGALYLMILGLTAGWQADKIQVNFEKFKIDYRSKYSTCHFI